MTENLGSRSAAIREEELADRDGVRAVNLAAFGGSAEVDLVARLQADGDALFGLVAVAGDRIVGHILFSRLDIDTAGGTIPAAALAPLAVLPERQGRGIGSALVRAGLAGCQKRRLPAVVVLGDPAYYRRFGFRAELARTLRAPWPGPHLMAIELVSGGLGRGGVARYPAAFAIVGS